MLIIKHENSVVLHTHTHTSSTLNNTKKVVFTKNVKKGKIDTG